MRRNDAARAGVDHGWLRSSWARDSRSTAGWFAAELIRLVLGSALKGEMTDHLGYDKHERGGSMDGNAHNGTRSRTVLAKAGPVAIDVPPDRADTLVPRTVAKRRRRIGSIEDIVLSLSARGMTHGDITAWNWRRPS